jgi:hypothetical protein
MRKEAVVVVAEDELPPYAIFVDGPLPVNGCP